MATVSTGHKGVGPTTLTANTVYTVTFTDDVTAIEVISDGAADCWYTINGSTPAVPTAGASTPCSRLPSGVAAVDRILAFNASDTVKFISAGTPTVSVQAISL